MELDLGVSLLSEDSNPAGSGRPVAEADIERLLEDSVEAEGAPSAAPTAPASPGLVPGALAPNRSLEVGPLDVGGCSAPARSLTPTSPAQGAQRQDSWALIGLSGRLEDLCRDLRRSVEPGGPAFGPCRWQRRTFAASSLAAASVVTLWVVRRRGRSATAPQRSRVSALAPELVKVNEGVEDEDQEDQEVANARNTRKFELWPGISDTMVDFGGLPIPQRLADAFTERGIVEPSPIQETPQVMPKLARGEHVIIHAPTGGGKTLGYLLPLLARLQPTMHVGLQALLFVPTAELALQVGRELKWLIYVLAGGAEGMCWFNPQVPQEIACQVLLSRSNLWDAVRQDASIMVTTPGLIRSELQMLKWEARRFSETLKLFLASNLHTIITDEVDALTPLQSTVAKGPEKVGAAERVSAFVLDEVRSRYRNRPVQLVVSSATANSRKVGISAGEQLVGDRIAMKG
ncbi:DEAD-box ATP-dependent RNA helicase CshE [Durusdinium trenchii]|uniref:ATP-dependent RNA helicase n=1 Tax=Durusdinium trenchii TaxID=1381693 RepID=A0ABP0N4M1_9DINO